MGQLYARKIVKGELTLTIDHCTMTCFTRSTRLCLHN